MRLPAPPLPVCKDQKVRVIHYLVFLDVVDASHMIQLWLGSQRSREVSHVMKINWRSQVHGEVGAFQVGLCSDGEHACMSWTGDGQMPRWMQMVVHKEPLGVFVRLLCEFSTVFQLIMHFPFLRACSIRAVPNISPFLLNVPSRLANMGGRILAPGKEPPIIPRPSECWLLWHKGPSWSIKNLEMGVNYY